MMQHADSSTASGREGINRSQWLGAAKNFFIYPRVFLFFRHEELARHISRDLPNGSLIKYAPHPKSARPIPQIFSHSTQETRTRRRGAVESST